MKKPTFSEVVQALLLVAAGALFYFAYTYATDECDARGGVILKTLSGYACVAVERR